MASQGALEISSVIGHPPSLVTYHISSPRMVAKPCQCFLWGADLHPKDHNILLFTDASNVGWGTQSGQDSLKGLWSDREKSLNINVLELRVVNLVLKGLQDQCLNQKMLAASDNPTVVANINKQGRTHLADMCALLWRIMTWCQSFTE